MWNLVWGLSRITILKHVKADGKAGLYHRRQCVVSYSLTTMALLWLDAQVISQINDLPDIFNRSSSTTIPSDGQGSAVIKSARFLTNVTEQSKVSSSHLCPPKSCERG